MHHFGETTSTMTAQWTKWLMIIDGHANNLVKLANFMIMIRSQKIPMWRILREYSSEAFDEVEQMNFNNVEMSELCSHAGYACI